MSAHDSLLTAAETALTIAERAAFLDRFPSMKGAHVADVLAIVEDHDTHVAVIDPLYELHSDQVPEPGLLSVAAQLCIGLAGDEAGASWEAVSAMIERIRPLLGLTYDEYKSERAKRDKLEVLGPLGFSDARNADGRDQIYHPVYGNLDHHALTPATVIDWAFKVGAAFGREDVRAKLRELLDLRRDSPDPDE